MSGAASNDLPADAIAVVGMAGRFPGAPTVADLWSLVRDGGVGIRTFNDDELRAAGVPEQQLKDPRYVRARGALDEVAGFDAELFGMSPREAAFTDPQHRLFLECAFEALEDAAIDPTRGDASVGVFGGVSSSSYFLNQVLAGADPLTGGAELIDRLRLGSLGSEKDFLTTRVSYRLDLRGPSVDVQSACSTSALAVHLAAQSLLMHGCDVALAGGASVFVPHVAGYLAQAGGVLSEDGHCRPMDAGATGTVPGSGAGVVVLRRLEDALADGDPIRAVLLGSGLNNDGALKVGFGAPSVDGQADAIAEALSVAGVPASTIGLVETHGTGTTLGDPIEIAALKSAFGEGVGEPCALGGIKANIGHLDAAAGIAGFIKAVLALEQRTIPAQPEFESVNPRIDFEGRFAVPKTATPWAAGPTPRRAGVSSFGIGGTNVHLVLQEAPARQAPAETADVPQLLALSARSDKALAARGDALAAALDGERRPLADVALTLGAGRRAMEVRQAVVASSAPDAAARLRTPGALAPVAPIRRAVFLLPGQGAQRVGMASGLLAADARLRDHLRNMCARLQRGLGFDPWPLYSAPGASDERIHETWVAQPLLFALEVALGRRWIELGVEPHALLGHSLGELSAACLAGVFSEEDGLDLVVARGAILRDQPRGSMLAVRADADELEARLADGPEGVVVAARNGPGATSLSGPTAAIEELAEALTAEGVGVVRLATSHAFHSPLVNAAIEPFVERVAAVELRAPERTVISNLSGALLTDAEATDPAYWGRQLRDPVRFGDGVASLAPDEGTVFLELGPRALAPLVRAAAPASPRLACLAEPGQEGGDAHAWLRATGRLWAGGVGVRLDPFATASRGRRIGGLPTYPFERAAHWIERPSAATAARADAQPVPAGRVWAPSWRRRPAALAHDERVGGDWLLVAASAEPTEALERALAARDARVATAHPGDDAAVEAWLARVDSGDGPARVVHLAAASAPGEGHDALAAARDGFATAAGLAATLARVAPDRTHELLVVAQGLAEVQDGDPVDPGRATLLGTVRVAAQELAGVRVRLIDAGPGAEAATLVRELSGGEDDVVALRGAQRWVEHVEPLDLPERSGLRRGSTVVLLGGFGRMGRAMARWLVRERDARVVLASRSAPEHDPELAELGAEAHRVDATDAGALAELLDDVAARLGPIDAVFHLANAGARTPLDRTDVDGLLAPLTAKVAGTLALERALANHAPAHVVLSSSLAALLGGPGTASYAAANAFLDAFATSRRGSWRSVAWDVWADGRPVDGLAVDEAMGRLERVLASPGLHHVLVSARDLEQRRAEVAARLRATPEETPADGEPLQRAPRPALATPFVAPRNEIEAALAEIWGEVLGLEAVGVDDPFFDLGGDSLLATMLLSKVTKRFALDIPVERFFEAPTVAQAAVILSEELERGASDDELDELLAELGDLSDEDAAKLLQEDAP
ncbi:MAG: SDR family oxidoreductase [Planctomycetota bacterium]